MFSSIAVFARGLPDLAAALCAASTAADQSSPPGCSRMKPSIASASRQLAGPRPSSAESLMAAQIPAFSRSSQAMPASPLRSASYGSPPVPSGAAPGHVRTASCAMDDPSAPRCAPAICMPLARLTCSTDLRYHSSSRSSTSRCSSQGSSSAARPMAYSLTMWCIR